MSFNFITEHLKLNTDYLELRVTLLLLLLLLSCFFIAGFVDAIIDEGGLI